MTASTETIIVNVTPSISAVVAGPLDALFASNGVTKYLPELDEVVTTLQGTAAFLNTIAPFFDGDRAAAFTAHAEQLASMAKRLSPRDVEVEVPTVEIIRRVG